MSLFNNLFGFNENALRLLEIIGLDPNNIPRFRDCFYDTEKKLICVHTRTGGGNREEYETENDELAKHPLYSYDDDDDFDSTYANFYFNAPPEFLEEVNGIEPSLLPKEKWDLLFNAMKEKQ